MKKRNYAFWLVFTYIILAAVCVGLIVFFKMDTVSIVINAAMFFVIALIFIYSLNKFSVVGRVQRALQKAVKKINEDAKHESRYLWNDYKDEIGNGLFVDDILTTRYQKYVAEMLRLEQFKNADYKCDIEDYINKDIVDAMAKKNVLNLVAGTMTGLGILGTFIGLSFGLQFFNTGTASEITESISPLMEGIKIAFHTSIYGMIFSLVFSFVFRSTMESVYSQLDEFLSAFNTYVVGDSINDNESTQRELLQTIPEAIGVKFSELLGQTLSPVIYNMNKTMLEFAQTISDNQAEGMKGLVNEFVEKLNRAMGDSYRQLGRVINETCEIQRENNAYAQTVMDKLGTLTDNVRIVNDMSVSIINNLAGYISDVERLQHVINDNYTRTYGQIENLSKHEEVMNNCLNTLVENEKLITDNIASSMNDTIVLLGKSAVSMSNASNELSKMLETTKSDINSAANNLAAASDSLNNRLAQSLNATFSVFDSNLAQITGQLNETVSGIDAVTKQVPEVVVAACDGMRKSFEAMQKEIRKN